MTNEEAAAVVDEMRKGNVPPKTLAAGIIGLEAFDPLLKGFTAARDECGSIAAMRGLILLAFDVAETILIDDAPAKVREELAKLLLTEAVYQAQKIKEGQ